MTFMWFPDQEKCKAGLEFVHGELIGWLYCGLLLLWCHAIDRLSRPRASKHVIREEKRILLARRGSYFDYEDYEGTQINKK